MIVCGDYQKRCDDTQCERHQKRDAATEIHLNRGIEDENFVFAVFRARAVIYLPVASESCQIAVGLLSNISVQLVCFVLIDAFIICI